MKFVIAPDKFKGSLPADRVAYAIKSSLELKYPEATLLSFPMADGGDGTLEILLPILGLKKEYLSSVDAVGNVVNTWYGSLGENAYIELAMTSGLAMLNSEGLNPFKTSTYGTGLVIKDAIEKAFTHIYLFVGGSATHDGGLGILQALGYILTDADGNFLKPNGSCLSLIKHIKAPKNGCYPNITLLTDVNNLLCGSNGAANVYAIQKGAKESDLSILDKGLHDLGLLIKKAFGMDCFEVPGLGAAGGVGAGLLLLGAKIESGSDFLINLLHLEKEIESCDALITGEGSFDDQSFNDKVVGKLYKLCQKHHKGMVVICGQSKLTNSSDYKGMKVISLVDEETNAEMAMKEPQKYIVERILAIDNLVN